MHSVSSSVVLLAICGLAAAGPLHHHIGDHHGSGYAVVSKHEEPVAKHEWSHGGGDGGHTELHGHEVSHDFHAHPKYDYDYAVKDEKTGDAKKHWESRDGDKVTGAYTIQDADGTLRIVEYTADHEHGFKAVVKTVGHGHETHEIHGGH